MDKRIEYKDGKYKCKICGKAFENINAVRGHLSCHLEVGINGQKKAAAAPLPAPPPNNNDNGVVVGDINIDPNEIVEVEIDRGVHLMKFLYPFQKAMEVCKEYIKLNCDVEIKTRNGILLWECKDRVRKAITSHIDYLVKHPDWTFERAGKLAEKVVDGISKGVEKLVVNVGKGVEKMGNFLTSKDGLLVVGIILGGLLLYDLFRKK